MWILLSTDPAAPPPNTHYSTFVFCVVMLETQVFLKGGREGHSSPPPPPPEKTDRKGRGRMEEEEREHQGARKIQKDERRQRKGENAKKNAELCGAQLTLALSSRRQGWYQEALSPQRSIDLVIRPYLLE